MKEVKEIWKVHPDILGYEFSNYGNYRNIGNNGYKKRRLKLSDNGHGYYMQLSTHETYDNGKHKVKSFYLADIIASLFVDNPNCYDYVVPIDGNILNCRYDNLMFVNWRDLFNDFRDGEEWRVIDFAPNYHISSSGRVLRTSPFKRRYYPELLTPYLDNHGYYCVNLSCNDDSFRKVFVHRLVANAFCDHPDCYDIVNHIDEDKTNNDYRNLMFTTHKGNTNWGTGIERMSKSHLKPVLMYDLDGHFIKRYDCSRSAAIDLGLDNYKLINSCARGNFKTAYGYSWKYESGSRRTIMKFDMDHNFICEYDNCGKASRDTGIDDNLIYECCNGRLRSAFGYLFEYRYSDYDDFKGDDSFDSVCDKEISDILKSLDINHIYRKQFSWLVNKRLMNVDFFLPDYNVCIEYQGIRHFEKRVQKIETYYDIITNDALKKKLCYEHGIDLYYINYDEDIESKLMDILKSIGAIDNNVIRDSYSLW